jgi:hypothetical protein
VIDDRNSQKMIHVAKALEGLADEGLADEGLAYHPSLIYCWEAMMMCYMRSGLPASRG